MIKRLPYALIASTLVLLGSWGLSYAATSVFQTFQGGTGTSTPSGILYGDNGVTGHLNTVTIGSNLSFIGGTLSATGGGGGTGTVSTSTHETAGSLSYWTSNSGTPALLGQTATTTIAGTGIVNVSNAPYVIGASPSVVSLTGGANGQILAWLSGIPAWTASTTFSSPLLYSAGNVTCQTASGSQAGCLSSADWTTFNSKSGFAYPFTNNTWGNSTSTVTDFTLGIITNASTTFSQLGTGFVQSNNGLLSSAALTSGNITTALGFTPSSFAFPWTIHTGYSSTSTVLDFTNGLFTNGSTTLAQLGTGFVQSTNGLLSSAALTSSNITTALGYTPQAAGFQITTTTPLSISNLAYFTGVTPTSLGGVATTSATCSGTVSCTAFTVLGASPITLTGTGGSASGLATTSPVSGGNLLEYSAVGAGSAFGIATGTLSAGTTGLTLSGTPTLVNGASTLAGTLAIANGGSNATSYATNVLLGYNGTSFVATGTPQLTVGNILATSTTATSTFNGPAFITHSRILQVGSGTNYVPTGGATPSYLIIDRADVNQDASVLLSTNGVLNWEIGEPGEGDLLWKSITGTESGGYVFTNRLFMSSTTGAVGYGTQSPTGALEVATSAPTQRAQETITNKNTGAGDTGSALVLNNQAGHTFYVGTDAGLNGGQNAFLNWGSFGTGLFFDSSANIGIDTTSINAGSTLTVNGNATFNNNVGIASTTPAFTFSVGTLSSAFYINSSGEVVGYDTATGFSGQISPLHYVAFKLATTTAWTGSTSQPYDADIVAPFTGTIKNIACTTDTGTLTLEGTDSSTHVYLTGASTTANTNIFSLSVTKGDTLNFIAGTPASSPTWLSCTLGAIQTP